MRGSRGLEKLLAGGKNLLKHFGRLRGAIADGGVRGANGGAGKTTSVAVVVKMAQICRRTIQQGSGEFNAIGEWETCGMAGEASPRALYAVISSGK